MLLKSIDNKLIEDLYASIPSFANYVEINIYEELRNSSYTLYGPLGGYLVELILSNIKENEKIIKQIFEYINILCLKNDKNIEEMLRVTFYERLMDYKISIKVSRYNLNNRALKIFNEVLNGPIFKGASGAK